MAYRDVQADRRLSGGGARVLTAEQAKIVANDPANSILIVQAYAGTGKTSTLEELARKWGHRKGLYLAFNKAIATEAERRFPGNITARTAHGYAYRALGVSEFQNRLVPRLKRKDITEANIDLSNSYVSMDKMKKCLLLGLQNFAIDGTDTVTAVHCGIDGLSDAAQEHILPILAANIERFIMFKTSRLPFTHDIYLKHFELFGSISEDYDYLLVDEAQDLNPVLISMIRKTKKPAIIVGDPYQSIYAFRGAVSAMKEFEGPRLSLTQSWRFGPAVATLANRILAYSGDAPDQPIIGRPGHVTQVERYTGMSPPQAFILSRTNARLFEGLVNLKLPFHVAGGYETIASQLKSAWHLSRHELWQVNDTYIRGFDVWEDLVEEGDNGDPDAKRIATLVKEHGDQIPLILDRLRALHCARQQDAKIVLSTAHKAKGLEAPVVVILDDFDTPKEHQKRLFDAKISQNDYNQEINLIYVAATRAIDRLILCDKLYDALSCKDMLMPSRPEADMRHAVLAA